MHGITSEAFKSFIALHTILRAILADYSLIENYFNLRNRANEITFTSIICILN